MQRVWGFARGWASEEVHAQRLFARFEQSYPWLSDSGEQVDESQVIASLPSGESLWNQLAGRINGKVESLSVIGPYFDDQLRFLRTAKETLKPRQMTVGVDVAYSQILPSAASRLDGVNFVDLSKKSWKKAAGTAVHAKVLHIHLTSGRDLVFTGSANPSHRAWLAPPRSRNAEMGVLHVGAAAEQAVAALSLQRLIELPEVEESAWAEIGSRIGAREEGSAGSGARVEIAVPVEDGFAVSRRFVREMHPGTADIP